VLHTDMEFSQYSDSRYWTTDISANNDSQSNTQLCSNFQHMHVLLTDTADIR